jgi:hypothetical protein
MIAQALGARFSDQVIMLEPHPADARLIRPRFERHHVAGHQHILALRDEDGRLGMPQPNTVPGVVRQGRFAGVDKRLRNGGVHIGCARPSTEHRFTAPEGRRTNLKHFLLPNRRHANGDGVREVAPIAVEHDGKIQNKQVAQLQTIGRRQPAEVRLLVCSTSRNTSISDTPVRMTSQARA